MAARVKATGRWIPVAKHSGVYAQHKLRQDRAGNPQRCPADVAAGETGARCRCEPSYRAQVYDRQLKRAVPSPSYGSLAEALTAQTDMRNGRRPAPVGPVVEGEPAPAGITVAKLLDLFYDAALEGRARTAKKKPFSATSVERYRSVTDRHIVPDYGANDAAAMDDVAWQGVLAVLAARPSARALARDNGATLGGQAIACIMNPVRSAYRWACQPNVKLLAHNPTRSLDMPARAKAQRKRVVTVAQARLMVAAIEDRGARVLWATMFYCGLRVSEAIALDWSDISLTRHVLTVQKSKTEAGEGREIPMPADLEQIIRDWRGPVARIGALVPGARGPRMSYDRLVDASRAAWTEVPQGESIEHVARPRLTPHEARHTYASWLIASLHDLAEVMTYMGHANLVVTANYVKTLPDRRASSRDRLGAFLAGEDVAASG